MEQGTQNQGKPTALSNNLTIPVSVLTHAFQNYAKLATTRQDKHYLFGLVEGVGTSILQNRGSNPGGFTMEGWMSDCGVDPNWATIAA